MFEGPAHEATMRKMTRNTRKTWVSGEIVATSAARSEETNATTPTWSQPVIPTDATIETMTGVMTDVMTVGTLDRTKGMEVPTAAAATGYLE